MRHTSAVAKTLSALYTGLRCVRGRTYATTTARTTEIISAHDGGALKKAAIGNVGDWMKKMANRPSADFSGGTVVSNGFAKPASKPLRHQTEPRRSPWE